MTILEISQLSEVSSFAPVHPFVYECRPGGLQLADFWTNTFGVEDQSRDYTIDVQSFIRDFSIRYPEVESYNDLLVCEGCFYWDNSTQILYIHFEHQFEGWNATYQYGSFFGFSDKRLVYLDDQEYTPIILSTPSVAQKQDIINYDKLSLMNGNIILSNLPIQGTNGQNDNFITSNIYGNDVFLYYYPDDMLDEYGNGSREHLKRVGTFYIEDYRITLRDITIRVQDARKSQNKSFPTEKFKITDYPDIGDFSGDVIPLMYGQVREAKAIPTNGETTTGDVNFRVALTLNTLGTVQVNIDDVWTTVSPSSTDLPNGEFVLSAANGRNANGGIYQCRVLNPIGIPITYLSDIIKDLNSRYLNIDYLDSFYSTTEWEAEEIKLSSGGWVFDSQLKIFEAIQKIQNGSTVGFRYEINNFDGKRTIRVDDPTRAKVGMIHPEDIRNRDSMPVDTDSDQVFAIIEVPHSKSFNSGKFQRIENEDNATDVLIKYKETKSLNIKETMLNNQTDAETRGQNDSEKFKTIPEIMRLELTQEEFLDLRIYDIFDINATPDFADADNNIIVGREYYGFIEGQVIGINPKIKDKYNIVDFRILR